MKVITSGLSHSDKIVGLRNCIEDAMYDYLENNTMTAATVIGVLELLKLDIMDRVGKK